MLLEFRYIHSTSDADAASYTAPASSSSSLAPFAGVGAVWRDEHVKKNCFAHLTSQADYSSRRLHSSIDFALGSKSFGYFSCHFRSEDAKETSRDGAIGDDADDGAEVLREIVLQCFHLSAPFEVLLLEENFATKCCGLRDGQMVILEPISRVLNASQLEIVPETLADWQIIENTATVIEEIFLEQIRILRPRMRFLLHLGANLPCSVCVGMTVPELPTHSSTSAALLVTNETLVLVAPFKRDDEENIDAKKKCAKAHVKKFAVEKFFENENVADDVIRRFILPKKQICDTTSRRRRIFRCAPQFDELVSSRIGDYLSLIITLNSTTNYTKTYIIEVEGLKNRYEIVETEASDAPTRRRHDCCCAVWIDVAPASLTPTEESMFHDVLRELNKYNSSGKMMSTNYCWISAALRAKSSNFSDCSLLEINPIASAQLCRLSNVKATFSLTTTTAAQQFNQDVLNHEDLKRQLFAALSTECALPFVNLPMLLQRKNAYCSEEKESVYCSDGFIFNYRIGNNESMRFEVRIFSAEKPNERAEYFYFWPSSQRTNCVVEFVKRFDGAKSPSKSAKKNCLENYATKKHFGGYFDFQTKLANELEAIVSAKLLKKFKFPQHALDDYVLLCGDEFAGKTTTAQLLAHNLFYKNSLLIFSSRIDCAEWKDQTAEVICARLRSTIRALLAKSPALLLLDNFDALAACGSADDEEHAQLVRIIYTKILNELQTNANHFNAHFVAICLAKNEKNLPPEMRFWEGRRLFSHAVHVPKLKKAEQLAILARLLNANLPAGAADALDYEMNLNVGELCKLAERIRIQQTEEKSELSADEISKALKDRPRVGLFAQIGGQTPSDSAAKSLSFASIGGMADVKTRLIEIFVWPMKYPKLFANCGINLQSRAILYGPSGCGKTMLVRALASECGAQFNIINVRGPELLSKYIGESEENVRAVFERARATRPCILALDEFDALAPSRGHDNTGVTDRVVNQFLTELDGVESGAAGGDGVYVIAATNRLELIDRALLRPGRFDHKIFVGPPKSVEERVDVLRIHTSDVRLTGDVDLRDLALKCGDAPWKSAELRAWVLNAKYYALNELTKNSHGEAPLPTHRLTLNAAHFERVFDESKPKQVFGYTAADYALGSLCEKKTEKLRVNIPINDEGSAPHLDIAQQRVTLA